MAASPLGRLKTRLVAASLVSLIGGVLLTLTLHRFLALGLGLILSAAILSVTFVLTRRHPILRVTVIVDLGLIFLATWVDHSWVSTLYSSSLAAASLAVVGAFGKKLNSEPTLSELAANALKASGVTLAQNVDGWTAATCRGEVLMLREIAPGYGSPASWATPARLYNQLRPILERTKETGTPSVLFVTDAHSGVLYRGPRYSVVSLGRLGEYFRAASPKKTKQTKGPHQRVHHEGRVTRRVN